MITTIANDIQQAPRTEEYKYPGAGLLQAGLFLNGLNDDLNIHQLYLLRFGDIPCEIQARNIDSRKANDWFSYQYASHILNCYYKKWGKRDGSTYDLLEICYMLEGGRIVSFDLERSSVTLLFGQTDRARSEGMMERLQKFRKRQSRRRPRIRLLVNTRNGLETEALAINRTKLSINENYNDDFQAVHGHIMKRLSKKKDKGILLLHGKPGTGKTSYIRYLIGAIRKEVIFLPPVMAVNITGPDLVTILKQYPDSVLVIEDAEEIVSDRGKRDSSAVSALLNISDGLLSDCLNIQVICSFNTDLSKIDKALLRKGRLIARYEFGELETTKARALSYKLGFDAMIDKPVLLTDIYNQGEPVFPAGQQNNQIGFMRSAK